MSSEPTSVEMLERLHRKPDRGGDRALLDDVLDSVMVGTLSTVIDGLPWSVPMLFARDGDRILLHGSTGAGALRHVADGAPATFAAFVLDGLVVADALFAHSANYRSAVVRGTLVTVDDDAGALNVLSDKLIPGRVAEVRTHTRKELAATTTLTLPIVDGQWVTKARNGPPGAPADPSVWTGVVPARVTYEEPVTHSGTDIPESVRRLVGSQRQNTTRS